MQPVVVVPMVKLAGHEIVGSNVSMACNVKLHEAVFPNASVPVRVMVASFPIIEP